MLSEIDILRDVSHRLHHAGIAFMVTGSMAMNYYAQPRMTRDIDVVIAVRENDLNRMIKLFESDYYISRDAVEESVKAKSMFNIIHNAGIIKVDFIVRKDSEYRQVEFERRRKVMIEDFKTFLVSKEDLILSKLIWGRDSKSELQARDVRNLLGTGVDEPYLLRWIDALGLKSHYTEVVNG